MSSDLTTSRIYLNCVMGKKAIDKMGKSLWMVCQSGESEYMLVTSYKKYSLIRFTMDSKMIMLYIVKQSTLFVRNLAGELLIFFT